MIYLYIVKDIISSKTRMKKAKKEALVKFSDILDKKSWSICFKMPQIVAFWNTSWGWAGPSSAPAGASS